MKSLSFLLLVAAAFAVHADDLILEARTLHLGRPGSYEWEEFKDRPVDGEKLERRFLAAGNTTEQALRLWHSNVKLNWTVKLNGKRLGILTTAETSMETVLAIPPGMLVEGENILTLYAPPSLDDIEIGPVILTPEPVKHFLSAARIDVEVTDAIPCRLTLTRPDGTLQPLLASPEGAVAARTGVVYTRDGRAVISVPAGDYVLHAGRGFEWSVATQKLSVNAGETSKVALTLKREVDTQGWIAADSHIHTLTHSGHGDATIEERMLTIAGEGIELAMATDHNHPTDYAPAAALTGTAAAFTPVIGNEVTTKHGHFNAFPIQPGSPLVDAAEQDWAKLIPAIRRTPGVQVITLNHPRDLHSGFVPLGGLHFNPTTGKHRDADAMKIDAMEVITSAAMQSDIHLLFRDWFALLNRGHRIAAIASSDSHDVNRFILGQGRTYVAAKDDRPSGLDLDEIWRSYHEGRLLVSLGLLTTLKVDERFGIGDLATGLGSTVRVEIRVHGPSWVQADHLALYANGLLIREEKLSANHQPGEKAKVVWDVPKPTHDMHLIAIATGPGITEAFWEIPRPYQPSSKTFTSRVIGATNPVWIDADGDGKFEPAFAIAQRVLREAGGDPSQVNRENLDQAVQTQLDSLTP
ncbi:MAG: CehA/McbA family metallohydrolase [Verrucomicrobiaceae bacterium]|nr:CehA/McbA family metallohydrolase [Verrucomicrobiaceae bacterium]